MTVSWAAFAAALLLAYLVPGPDFLLVLHWATRSRREGFAAGAGAQAGLSVHVLLAVLGLTALIGAWPASLTIIRYVGAAYLVWLGLRLAFSGPARQSESSSDARGLWAAGRQAFGSNLLNPKSIVFISSVLPQFAGGPWPVWRQLLVLGVIDVLAGLVIWALVVALGRWLGGWLDRPGVDRWWRRANGTLLCALAVVLILHQS